MQFVRPMVYKGSCPLNAIMFLPPLSTSMPYIASIHHHRTILTPIPTTLDGRAILTFSIRTPTLNLKVLCSHLGSSIEASITHLLNPRLKSNLESLKLRLMNWTVSRSTSQLSSFRLAIYPALRSQPEFNIWGHINVIFVRGDGLEESLMMVIQETASVAISARIKGRKKRV